MSEYKLTYFDLKARAEPMRILFALADVPYDDIRIPLGGLGEIKHTLPYGQLPILEFGDTVLSQSATIGRFLARKYGFHGADELESAKIDEIVDAGKDWADAFGAVRTSKDDASKEAALKNFTDVATPKYLGKFCQLLEANGGLFFVGKSLSWADIVVYNLVDFLKGAAALDVTKDYPALKKFVDNFESTPKIKEWIETRPKTPF